MDKKFIVIAGPCVLETRETVWAIASRIKEMLPEFPHVDYYFKASFDKANRTSAASHRGPGIDAGLEMLAEIKKEFGFRVVTDFHSPEQATKAGKVVDVLQVPAFLSRQTDMLLAAGETGKIVNIKKAQFMAPEDIEYAVKKVESTGNKNIWVTERGVCMGYHTLVVDFRSFSIMAKTGYPVIFDATHAVQVPSKGGISAGNREYVLPLARAAAAYGIDGIFAECHITPEKSYSDAANCITIESLKTLLKQTAHARATEAIE